ncbi:hypothetical protein FC15_GL001643 [Lapidilactobacillus concavus DSM 17758]|uniref:Uncharacterized protein n=1 Tax=Lapidilactobacillus concavus DSM 17758 TaxID=1423735 RepID=A0A0R1W0K9_9LACO|nr:hypothetical protein FC15_GL001643 [Lapidilactobacillus concavus DSM 17758]
MHNVDRWVLEDQFPLPVARQVSLKLAQARFVVSDLTHYWRCNLFTLHFLFLEFPVSYFILGQLFLDDLVWIHSKLLTHIVRVGKNIGELKLQVVLFLVRQIRIRMFPQEHFFHFRGFNAQRSRKRF